MTIVLKGMGIPEEVIGLISSMYKEPQFNVKDDKIKSSTKYQQTGIRQGCPLSPYFFITLLSAIMKDIESNLTEEATHILDQGKLCKATFNKLFYADDTLTMTTTTEAAEFTVFYTKSKDNQRTIIFNLTNQNVACSE